MNEQKLGGLIGLAVRARQAQSGSEASRLLVKTGKCGVLLLDKQAAVNTREKAAALCRQSGVRMILIPEGLISASTGKDSLILAVQKGSFAEEILRISRDGDPERSITDSIMY